MRWDKRGRAAKEDFTKKHQSLLGRTGRSLEKRKEKRKKKSLGCGPGSRIEFPLRNGDPEDGNTA